MKVIETELPGVLVLEPKAFFDARGFFVETYREDTLSELGIRSRFVQDNQSRSSLGTLRGLHFQLRQPQAKLCRAAHGAVLDIVVDLRQGSPAFGKWMSVVLTDRNQRMVFLPRGCAHGFLALTDTVDFIYKCDDYYAGDDQCGIHRDDPELGVTWNCATVPAHETDPEFHFPDSYIISPKDNQLPTLKTLTASQLPVWDPKGNEAGYS